MSYDLPSTTTAVLDMAKRKIKVWYLLIDGEKRTALREASFVELSPDAEVARMKKRIKDEESIVFPASMLTVWRCTGPEIHFNDVDSDRFGEQLEKVFSEGKVERLKPESLVGELATRKVLIQLPGASHLFLLSLKMELHVYSARKVGKMTSQLSNSPTNSSNAVQSARVATSSRRRILRQIRSLPAQEACQFQT